MDNSEFPLWRSLASPLLLLTSSASLRHWTLRQWFHTEGQKELARNRSVTPSRRSPHSSPQKKKKKGNSKCSRWHAPYPWMDVGETREVERICWHFEIPARVLWDIPGSSTWTPTSPQPSRNGLCYRLSFTSVELGQPMCFLGFVPRGLIIPFVDSNDHNKQIHY